MHITRFDHLLGVGTAGTGLGGALLAQASQSPEITVGAIVLAAIGLASLWVRSHYALARDRLDVVRMRAELDVYRRIHGPVEVRPLEPHPIVISRPAE